MKESGLEKRAGVFARIKFAYEKITKHEIVSKKNHVVNAYLYCMEPGVSRRNHVVNAFIYPEFLKED